MMKTVESITAMFRACNDPVSVLEGPMVLLVEAPGIVEWLGGIPLLPIAVRIKGACMPL